MRAESIAQHNEVQRGFETYQETSAFVRNVGKDSYFVHISDMIIHSHEL